MEFCNLNVEQKKAVEHVNGPLLVLAGAGSGKTRVLTCRIANLIKHHKIPPWGILALTFTNKAAREMLQRVENLLGEDAAPVWLSTFHSFCIRILRFEAAHTGMGNNFVVYDDNDQLSVYDEIIKQLELDKNMFSKRLLCERISQAKNYSLNAEEFLRDEAFSEVYLKVYKLYQKRLKQYNALDFDDILLKTIDLFKANPEVLAHYQNRFKFIMVDEYQDTNMAQYELVYLLAKEHQNLFVVGDDDQSIYGWRGANIRNILEFEKDFAGAKIIRLEQNYRSTDVILDAANSVISNNINRKKKALWTEEKGGILIRTYCAYNEKDEADYICKQILEGIRQGQKADAFAVLYRTNAQSRIIETTLAAYGIAHQVYGGQRFYERAEIRDVLAYLRLFYNPADDIAFVRAINTPRRGIGNAAISALTSIASEKGISLYAAAQNSQSLPTAMYSKLKRFTDVIEDLSLQKNKLGLFEFTKKLLLCIEYDKYLKESKGDTYETRLENIDELLGSIKEFEEGLVENTDALGAYLENISLVSDIDALQEQNGRVALMTLHSAKGLEFHTVFIAGMEEGIFPNRKSGIEPKELEEERRLCYVGITRAMKALHLIHAQQRNLYGDFAFNPHSRFLEEIPDELCESCSASSYAIAAALKQKPSKQVQKFAHGGFGAIIREKDMPSSAAPSVQYKEYQRVKHAAFGSGTVLKIEGTGSAQIITIDFGTMIKKFAASYAPIEIE
ncbi:MAG TPA: UvrD-helicase domain-containing protein [Clostridia bacterium]|nr:UvrD-helicase domain-containing protein [Clostridia bacterium]